MALFFKIDRIMKDHQARYSKIITIEPGKRGGKPCIRGMRITVGDILGWLGGNWTIEEILDNFPELTHEDIQAALLFAADRENDTMLIAA